MLAHHQIQSQREDGEGHWNSAAIAGVSPCSVSLHECDMPIILHGGIFFQANGRIYLPVNVDGEPRNVEVPDWMPIACTAIRNADGSVSAPYRAEDGIRLSHFDPQEGTWRNWQPREDYHYISSGTCFDGVIWAIFRNSSETDLLFRAESPGAEWQSWNPLEAQGVYHLEVLSGELTAGLFRVNGRSCLYLADRSKLRWQPWMPPGAAEGTEISCHQDGSFTTSFLMETRRLCEFRADGTDMKWREFDPDGHHQVSSLVHHSDGSVTACFDSGYAGTYRTTAALDTWTEWNPDPFFFPSFLHELPDGSIVTGADGGSRIFRADRPDGRWAEWCPSGATNARHFKSHAGGFVTADFQVEGEWYTYCAWTPESGWIRYGGAKPVPSECDWMVLIENGVVADFSGDLYRSAGDSWIYIARERYNPEPQGPAIYVIEESSNDPYRSLVMYRQGQLYHIAMENEHVINAHVTPDGSKLHVLSYSPERRRVTASWFDE